MKEVDGLMIFVGYVSSKEVASHNTLNCALHAVVLMSPYRGSPCNLKKYGWNTESHKNPVTSVCHFVFQIIHPAVFGELIKNIIFLYQGNHL